jgi:flagellar biosynthesis/type III secretory pathway protein FliH
VSHIFHQEDFQEGYAEGYAVGAYEAQKNMVAAMFFQAGRYHEMAEADGAFPAVKAIAAAMEVFARNRYRDFTFLPRP